MGEKKEKEPKKELIEIIDGKRSYNVCIGLARFKMKNSDIKLAVLKMDDEVLNVDKLYKLISLVPTPEEVTQMQEYQGEDADLAKCERFFNQFRNMDNVKERLQIWSYKMTFHEEYDDQKKKVDFLSSMSETIRTHKGFKMTLAAILACGNFINGGTKKGGKHGFELETLTKIGAYKTTDATMSILGYIYKFLRQNYPDSLSWIDDMEKLPQVLRIETDALDSEITNLDKDLEKVTNLLDYYKTHKDDDDVKEEEKDMFESIMQKFYDDSLKKVQNLQKNFNGTIQAVQDLAKFYGEKVKPSQFKLEEFFGIFHEFRLTFIENRDKIVKAEMDKAKELKKIEARKKREAEMKLLKEKKRAEKEKKRKEREERKAKRKNKKKRVGFAVDGGGDDEVVSSKKKNKKGKTDKMLDEMGDAKKYLSKLRNKRKQQKSKANLLGSRKKSMFFKDRKAMMLDAAEIEKLQSQRSDDFL